MNRHLRQFLYLVVFALLYFSTTSSTAYALLNVSCSPYYDMGFSLHQTNPVWPPNYPQVGGSVLPGHMASGTPKPTVNIVPLAADAVEVRMKAGQITATNIINCYDEVRNEDISLKGDTTYWVLTYAPSFEGAFVISVQDTFPNNVLERIYRLFVSAPDAKMTYCWESLTLRNLATGELFDQVKGDCETRPLFGGSSSSQTPSQEKANTSTGNDNGATTSSGSEAQANNTDPKKVSGDPVDLFSGSYIINNVDLAVPGIIPPEVSRSYSSVFANEDGPFGMGTGMVPYNSHITVEKGDNGAVTVAAGTELEYSTGEHTSITFTDVNGNLEFTAPGKTGLAGEKIVVQTDSSGMMTGAQLVKDDGGKFTFNASGALIKIEDRNGNAVDIARDSEERVARVEDPSTGKGIDFTYDASNHIVQATGLLNQTVTYTYDDNGRLMTVTDPKGQSVQFSYDEKHRITAVTDARGTQIVQNTYNNDDQVTDQVLGDGSTFKIEYPNETDRKVTDGNGHVLERRYHAGSGMFTGFKTELNQEYTRTYSPALFDNSGGPRTITNSDPLGRTSTTELNAFNQPVRITDAAGRVIEMTYEPNFHQLASIQDPLGRITTFTYDASGNLIEVTDPDGNKGKFTYNAQGQVLSAKDPLGNVVAYSYDPSHDLRQVSDPLGNKVSFVYDSLSRLTKITDPNGNTSQYTYDILNRVTEIKDALGNTTTFEYDENGNVTRVTDPRGQATTASYDPMNRLISVTNAKGETATLNYDAVGNVVSTTDAKGQTTTYTYNPIDQVTRVEYEDGTAYDYSYDTVNRLTAISDGAQTHTFAYDILDRVIQASMPQGSITYSYDLVSRLTGFSALNSAYAPVQYAYDNLDRLIGITQQGKTYGYTYDKLGRRTSLTRPSGVTTTYAYDAASRLTEIRHAKGATVIETQTFVYDASGNLVSRVKTGGLYGNLTYQYGYDKLNRLIKTEATGILSASSFKNKGQEQAALQHVSNAAKLTNPTARAQQLKNAVKLGALLPETASWTFDPNGNISSKTVFNPDGTTTTRTLTYDAADRLIKITQPGGPIVTLSYDANGNMISDSTGRQMSWNAQDQLTHLSTPQLSASFAYDPLGRRVSLSKGAVSKNYFYNGLDMLSDGSARYLHGAGIDEPLEMQPAGTAPAQSYLQDHLGSTTRLLHAASGQATAQYDYTSYGDLEADAANPSLTNPFTYTGREDDGTGLMYYRARYYDPELEVFISQDPLGDKQRYANGDPLIYLDPLGLRSLTIYYGNGLDPSIYDTAHNNHPTDDYISAKNPAELKRLLDAYTESLRRSGEPFDDLNMYGHGAPDRIGQGTGDTLGSNPNAIEDVFGGMKKYPPKRVNLYMCEVGQLGGFAQALSKFLPKSIVGAPQQYYSPDKNGVYHAIPIPPLDRVIPTPVPGNYNKYQGGVQLP